MSMTHLTSILIGFHISYKKCRRQKSSCDDTS